MSLANKNLKKVPRERVTKMNTQNEYFEELMAEDHQENLQWEMENYL